MADIGTRYTDMRQAEIERRLRRIYGEAQRDLKKKLREHTNRFKAFDAVKRQQLADGQITSKQYSDWKAGQVFTGKLWKEKMDAVASTINNANVIANGIINGVRRSVFAENATYQAYRLEHDLGMNLSFSIYDSAAVTRLLRSQPELLKRRVINDRVDKAWNREIISDAVTKGIITGAKIEDIADDIAEKTALRNEGASVRYARTAMTAAQNAGRYVAMHDAEEMGIKVKKLWIATLDSRTRDSHAALDGEAVAIDEEFSNGLMYPGDPDGPAAEVWNCRCAMGYKYDEYASLQKNATRYDQENGELIENMTYKEWKASKLVKQAVQVIASGGHISEKTVGDIFNGDIEREAIMAQSIGCSHDEAEGYTEAVMDFCGNAHIRLRAYQQGKDIFKDDLEYLTHTDRMLEEFIEKAPKWNAGKTYRAIGLTNEELDDILEKAKRGDIIDMKGTASWSSEVKVAQNHKIGKENRVIFVCEMQNSGASVVAYSLTPWESEVIVSKKARYRAIGIKHGKDATYIYLEEL